MPRLNAALSRVASAIRRIFGRKPDPTYPYAYACVRNPRTPPLRSGTVAFEEPRRPSQR